MQRTDTILGIKASFFIMLFILGLVPSFGQNYKKAGWSRVKMDSVYDCSKGKATKVIGRHKATSGSLLKPVGKNCKKLEFNQLSGFVTDVMLDYAAQRMARATKNPQAKADLSVVNFRDKDVCLPAGDIAPCDIFSLFPMDNKLIMFDLKGKYVRELIQASAKTGAVSSLREEFVENDRIYKVVAIDYLLRKGDSANVLEHAENLEDCNMPLSNVLIQYFKRYAQKGEMIIGK